MRRLTSAEAAQFLEDTLDCSLDMIGTGVVEAWHYDATVDQVRADLESYVATLDAQIDLSSVSITADRADGGNVPCVHIFIRTELVQ